MWFWKVAEETKSQWIRNKAAMCFHGAVENTWDKSLKLSCLILQKLQGSV